MFIKKDGEKEIRKRMIDLDLKNSDVNEAAGYNTERGFKDFLTCIKRGRGYIKEDKLKKIEEKLGISLADYYG